MPDPNRFARWTIFAAVAAGAALAAGAVAAQGPLPSYTEAQAARGRAMYVGACADCHGERLDDGQFAPPLKGAPHKAYWAGKSAADLVNYMNSAMPPTAPGSLGGQNYADILAYLLQQDGAPAGATEVPADPAALAGASATP